MHLVLAAYADPVGFTNVRKLRVHYKCLEPYQSLANSYFPPLPSLFSCYPEIRQAQALLRLDGAWSQKSAPSIHPPSMATTGWF